MGDTSEGDRPWAGARVISPVRPYHPWTGHVGAEITQPDEKRRSGVGTLQL